MEKFWVWLKRLVGVGLLLWFLFGTASFLNFFGNVFSITAQKTGLQTFVEKIKEASSEASPVTEETTTSTNPIEEEE